jgi:metabotropic glutamate receptor 3
MNVSFTTAEKDYVEFNQDGDVLAHYDIMNFQKMQNGTYSYIKIGDWNNHTLNFSDEIKPPTAPNATEKFTSVCSKPCKAGQYKVSN